MKKKREQSIVLQKKMLLYLSVVIIAVFSLIFARESVKNNNSAYAINSSNLNFAANNDEYENEITEAKTRFLATKIVQGDILNFDSNNLFAGDVLNLEKEINLEETIEDENSGENISNNDELKNVEVVINDEPKNDTNENSTQTVSQNGTNQLIKYKDIAEDNPPTEYVKVVEATATAYCLCTKCCGKTPDNPNYGHTRSGFVIKPGTGVKVIAVDPNVIPLNSKVYVEGLNGMWDYGTAIAADTGSAIKNLKIDLYVDTHEEALEWGRRKVNVYILGE